MSAYFMAWAVYGLIAYGVFRLIDALDMGALAWGRAGPYVAGGAIVAAGLYQLAPLKDVCLRHCRSPIHFLAHGWRDGARGAFRMGFTHGLYCVGCCWGLMLVLFSLGVMSLVWMAAIATVIFAEKVVPSGERLTRMIGVAFVVLGLWIAVTPGSVPGLTDPGTGHGPVYADGALTPPKGTRELVGVGFLAELRELSSMEIYALFIIGLLALMVVLVIRAIRAADEDGLESAGRPSLIQRLFEGLGSGPWPGPK